MRNIEVKVRVADVVGLERVWSLAGALGAADHGASRDVDTYFAVPRGRLKLRQSERQPHGHGTLIYYERPDASESRHSDYTLLPVADAETLTAMLSTALGIRVVVAKTRHLLIYGSTRIHLDQVDSLGSFVELETVLTSQPEDEAQAEHRLVWRALDLDPAQIVPGSYSDLLLHWPIPPISVSSQS